MAYSLSRKAEEDVISIFLESTEKFGLQQAERYHHLLEKSFEFLSANPLASRLRHEIVPPVRIHPIESHIIVYTVDEKEEVFIVRVRHSREEWLDDSD